MPKDNQISEKYRCSITHQIMIDPVFAADGYTYEREAIEQWLQTHDTSPKTNIKLKHKDLTDNHDKRSDVLDFLDSRFSFMKEMKFIFHNLGWRNLLLLLRVINLKKCRGG